MTPPEPACRPPRGTVFVPVSWEMMDELRAGVPCAGVQLIGDGPSNWCLLVLRDADRPFLAAPDVA